MDGVRIQNYWSKEVEALLATYKQFEILVPSQTRAGAAHQGEDGRYVEDLIGEYLRKFLPKGLEVLTGFILRPAVKTGDTGRERSRDVDQHSTQLDIIIYDTDTYPVFQRFADSVIVPPEGVIAIISVKKHLNDADIFKECQALWNASKLCRTKTINQTRVRGPYLALVSMHSHINKPQLGTLNWIFSKLQEAYDEEELPKFDDLVGFIGALDSWSIFKKRPCPVNSPMFGKYLSFDHQPNEEHLGLQFLLTGVLSVFYDETRRNIRRPGYTAFPSGRSPDSFPGEVPCTGLR
ncbi:DUF6602 domain-containing protein [Vibrio apostichopi]|uniref:DUF6602 domain-containing protein n=1 Tax=Vibrio apostichopi TaxID=3035453 RepID=UPI0025735B9A|nr:DUF6602 domain-containing protein [Vibrio sp. FE10]